MNHFRRADCQLEELLRRNLIRMHPLVAGELVCGNLPRREETLRLLLRLPPIRVAEDREILHVVENRKPWGKGIGWIDAALLASALLSGCPLWTHDRRLGALVRNLGFSCESTTARS